MVYEARGGVIAATLTPVDLVLPPTRRGPDALSIVLVVYSVDRASIISGYQVSTPDRARIPREALWLR